MEELTLKSFEEAAEKVKEATLPTNLVYSEYFSSQTGNRVYLKPENMQYTGAYKVRGAYYKISTMSEEARQKGLITASAGNHAQGVAFAAKKYGVKATVVMPTTTPLIKVNRTKGYGAEAMNVYFAEKQDGRLVHYESAYYNRAYEDTISDLETRMYAKPEDVEKYLNPSPDVLPVSDLRAHTLRFRQSSQDHGHLSGNVQVPSQG